MGDTVINLSDEALRREYLLYLNKYLSECDSNMFVAYRQRNVPVFITFQEWKQRHLLNITK